MAHNNDGEPICHFCKEIVYLDELGEYWQWASSWHLQMGWPNTTKQTKDTRWEDEFAHGECLTDWLAIKHGRETREEETT